jgi:hypothetical protein
VIGYKQIEHANDLPKLANVQGKDHDGGGHPTKMMTPRPEIQDFTLVREPPFETTDGPDDQLGSSRTSDDSSLMPELGMTTTTRLPAHHHPDCAGRRRDNDDDETQSSWLDMMAQDGDDADKPPRSTESDYKKNRATDTVWQQDDAEEAPPVTPEFILAQSPSHGGRQHGSTAGVQGQDCCAARAH